MNQLFRLLFKRALFLLLILSALLPSLARAEILHDWQFDDPPGEPLNHIRSEANPLIFWSQSFGDSATTGEETFRIRRNVSGLNSRFNLAPGFEKKTVYLILDIAGWNLSGSVSRNPQLRLSFMNGTAGDTPAEITAELRITRQNSGQLTLQALAEGPDGQNSSAISLFPPRQSDPLSLVLAYNPLYNSYQVRYKTGTSPWQLFHTGNTSPQRSGPSVRLYLLGDFQGNGQNYLDIERIRVTTDAPFSVSPEPVFLNQNRTESGTMWDLKETPFFIGESNDQNILLTLKNQGRLRSGFTSLGKGARTSADVLVSGRGTLWLLEDGDLRIAENSTASAKISVTNGGVAKFGETRNPENRFGTGKVSIGHTGNGSLKISAGGFVSSAKPVYLGYQKHPASGSIEIDGPDSRMHAASNVHLAANAALLPSGGSASIDIRNSGILQIDGSLTIHDRGHLSLNSNGSLTIGNHLILKSGGTFNFKNGSLEIIRQLQIDSGANFLWSGGNLTADGLISGITEIPPGATLHLNAPDGTLRHESETALLINPQATLSGSGHILQHILLSDPATSHIQGELQAPIRLLKEVSGSGLISHADIADTLSPSGTGITLVNSTLRTNATIRIAIGESAPILRLDETSDITHGSLEITFTNPSTTQTSFKVFDFFKNSDGLLPFRSINLPDGWELHGDFLIKTGAPSIPDFESWTRFHNLTGMAAKPEADPDGDGLDNRSEFLLGTIPTNGKRDGLSISLRNQIPDLQWRERITGDALYLLEQSHNLNSWEPAVSFNYSAASVKTSDRPGYRTITFPVPAEHPNAFFRISAMEATPKPVFPAKSWEQIANPESAGIPSHAITAALQKLSQMDTTAFMAILDGKILFDYGDTSFVSYSASTRKSILAMLYGRYVDSGIIDLDASLEEIGIDDNLGLLPIEKQATVHDLLRARSGIYHPRSNPGDNWDVAPPRGSQTPGTYYLYNNWDFNALGSIFTKLTGKSPYEALETDFSRVLEMEDFSLENQRWGGNLSLSEHRAYYFYLSTRDMARLGHLMLRNGNWNGEQIISESWMEQMLHPWTPSGEMNPTSRRSRGLGYSYLWWLREATEESPYFGSYAAHGAGGQYIMVVPKLNLVFAHKTNSSGTDLSVSRTEFYDLADILVQAMIR